MQLLEEKIAREGKIIGDDILKVDMFLNHKIDVAFLDEIGKEFYRLFSGENITKIVTAESSGIAIACMAARYFSVPVVFAKKGDSKNSSDDKYSAQVYSFTRGKTYNLNISKEFMSKGDRVLILDDFLANGNAALGLADIVEEAQGIVCGVGIVIEKSFQKGEKRILERGYKLHSLAKIGDVCEGKITFIN